MSRPVWARGLKLHRHTEHPARRLSRPVWARGLKRQGRHREMDARCRAPCGRVD